VREERFRRQDTKNDLRKTLRSLRVIASEAKQSIEPHEERMDCFVADAPRNDGIVSAEISSVRLKLQNSSSGHLMALP
jgi:hypothetical protein